MTLSLVLFIYERALIPVYGSGPTTYTLKSATIIATLSTAAHPFKLSLIRNSLLAALLFSSAPLATYWVAVFTSRWNRPILGPILTHFVVLVPLLSVLTAFVGENNVRVSSTLLCESGNEFISEAAHAQSYWVSFTQWIDMFCCRRWAIAESVAKGIVLEHCV
jgi:hypothetical protein